MKTETSPYRLLLRISETMTALGLGRTTVYRMIQDGELPVVRVGKAIRVPVEALDTWIKQKEETKTNVR